MTDRDVPFISVRGEINEALVERVEYERAKASDGPSPIIIMNYQSWGGPVSPKIDNLAEKIYRDRERIVAVTSTYCCSAAYHLYCAAGRLYATEGAIVGGIGTIFDRDALSDPDPAPRDITPEFRAYLDKHLPAGGTIEGALQSIADDFINYVARYRGLDPEYVRRIAAGKVVYRAADALQIGLIDEIIYKTLS